MNKTKKGQPIQNDDDRESRPLTEKGLENSCQGSYKHDLLDIETELEKEKADKDELKKK